MTAHPSHQMPGLKAISFYIYMRPIGLVPLENSNAEGFLKKAPLCTCFSGHSTWMRSMPDCGGHRLSVNITTSLKFQISFQQPHYRISMEATLYTVRSQTPWEWKKSDVRNGMKCNNFDLEKWY
ncbi:uncharacterized protein LOC144311172 [Canis aureus]